ncbi:patatin-like phospholipase family protein [Ramlibacter sp. AN1133]|uniref:patatin-like phospholipase family protein n=1 Tax=Ramlibacter sp. AN1133 TaxID=3133429 RepID=UPI0030C1C6A5
MQSAVTARRAAAGYPDAELARPHWALALSGGGIRSATFCFGLIRAFARNGVFRRFDHLSTVSGGGYIGAALGRLYDGKRTAAEVEAGIARDDTLLLWWLRSNGRYLTPAGARDLGQAFASVFRGIMATQFEVGMLLIVMTGLLLLPYVLLQAVNSDAWAAWLTHFHENAGSFWFLALSIPIAFASHNIFAYWFVRGTRTSRSTATDLLVAAACAYLGWNWGSDALNALAVPPSAPRHVLAALACLLLFTPATAIIWRLLHGQASVPAARLGHTKGLALSLWALLLMAVAGILDWASWFLARWLAEANAPLKVSLVSALPVPLVAGARLALPRIRKWMEQAKTRPVKTERLLHIAGLSLLMLLALAWATMCQFLIVHLQWQWLHVAVGAPGQAAAVGVAKWLVLVGLPLIYILARMRDLEMLNLSSLHNFYRARIERAYVSCGNAERFGQSVLAGADRPSTSLARSVIEAMHGDDIELAQYQPHAAGGPIHLVNCCINQTLDDRTQNYNADRKGVALTVSSFGAETGGELPPADAAAVPGKLSTWAAISGAAASSGMGSQTSPGLAALLFLSGLRLGFWHASLLRPDGGTWRALTRPELIHAEGMARFPGLRSPQWYLSDGGHFENTGVYALLKRKARLIVVADCGADPDYRWEDVENLVRKAKIDYGTVIRFVLPPELGLSATDAEKSLHASIGSPSAIQREEGNAWLLLGCVTYADGSGATLLVVKPRPVPGMTLDLSSYAARNKEFPQQSTGDQFFDEMQWEAYHQLGLMLGAPLTEANLNLIETWAVQACTGRDA